MTSAKFVEVPRSLVGALRRVLHELAQGNAVVVAPIRQELTTQQAADLLNISRPFLIKLLESGEIPFHKVGLHRRVSLRDLLAYREQRSQGRREALTRMGNESQAMGLYE
ncbi:MAG: helix-turn-helix domain-containing protein [Chloroflexi bacterium]|nr:helix-turn-helix domain-containing protein [Chloroflexota bacterium]